GVDKDEVEINRSKYLALIDSGPTENIITSFLFNQIENVKKLKLQTPFKISLLNGDMIVAHHKTNLRIKYRGQSIEASFLIIDSGIVDLILGDDLVCELRDLKRTFPVICEIVTPSDKVVSWARKFKACYLKTKFLNLIDDYVKRGILEPSKFAWLNPVQLQTKKNGDLRFTLDLRRLNTIVE
ncbi:hypothetical protein M153_37830003, partial [Pseudoloma neurophilia]